MDDRRGFLTKLGFGVAALPSLLLARTAASADKGYARKKSPPGGSPPSTQARGGDAYPGVTLINQESRKRRLYQDLIKDKVVMLHFMSIAGEPHFPAVARMVRIADKMGAGLGRDYQIYSISIDPVQDTPSRLKAFARSHGALRPGWQFLTAATQHDVDAIGKRLLRPMPGMGDGHPNTALVYYGNGSVGLWSGFPIMLDDPDLAVERVSWIRSGSKPKGPPRRAGPRVLAGDFKNSNRIV